MSDVTEHLGGPESPDKLRERQGRYERLKGGDRMFKIVEVTSGTGVGSVGFWTKEWNAICHKLGFELLEVCEFEFPKGHFMTCNDWLLDLRA